MKMKQEEKTRHFCLNSFSYR